MLRAHALGAERDIEVNICNKTFEQNSAKITFHIYNNSYLQTIEMGWWSKFESAQCLMEGIDGWEFIISFGSKFQALMTLG